MEDNELKDDLIPTNEAAPHNDNTHNNTESPHPRSPSP